MYYLCTLLDDAYSNDPGKYQRGERGNHCFLQSYSPARHWLHVQLARTWKVVDVHSMAKELRVYLPDGELLQDEEALTSQQILASRLHDNLHAELDYDSEVAVAETISYASLERGRPPPDDPSARHIPFPER